MHDALRHFADPQAVASYVEDTARHVPGLADLHRMAALLLAEAVPPDGQVLVLGAGGGLELKAQAGLCAGWRFTGVDPSPAMLDLARRACAGVADRITWLTGTVDEAPPGPFDGATCLLTLHFLDRAGRQRTLAGLHRRLRPGARLLVAHHAPPADAPVDWLTRSLAFRTFPAVDVPAAKRSATTMAERLHLLTPEQEEALLREAGFVDVALCYAALSFRGWVATVAH
ncbi:class I SAM-dependent methyltransferase [Ideonella sp.]|uniref:class I SAM-dependent methyltransferase n=1 Tax=Ideonella sp. TaxID=1929293 RepID=UPI0035AE0360